MGSDLFYQRVEVVEVRRAGGGGLDKSPYRSATLAENVVDPWCDRDRRIVGERESQPPLSARVEVTAQIPVAIGQLETDALVPTELLLDSQAALRPGAQGNARDEDAH